MKEDILDRIDLFLSLLLISYLIFAIFYTFIFLQPNFSNPPQKIIKGKQIIEAFKSPIAGVDIQYLFVSVMFDSPVWSRFSTIEFHIIGQNLSKEALMLGIPFLEEPLSGLGEPVEGCKILIEECNKTYDKESELYYVYIVVLPELQQENNKSFAFTFRVRVAPASYPLNRNDIKWFPFQIYYYSFIIPHFNGSIGVLRVDVPEGYRLLYNRKFVPTVLEINGENISTYAMTYYRKSRNTYHFGGRWNLSPNKIMVFLSAFARYDSLRIRWFIAAIITLFLFSLHVYSLFRKKFAGFGTLLTFSSLLSSFSWVSFFWNDAEILAGVESVWDYISPFKYPLLWAITTPLIYLVVSSLIREILVKKQKTVRVTKKEKKKRKKR